MPSPLIPLDSRAQIRLLWTQSIGRGMDQDYLKLGPVVVGPRVFIADKTGHITALALATGKIVWQVTVKRVLALGAHHDTKLLLCATDEPQLIALEQTTGRKLWSVSLPNQTLASPVIGFGIVVIKTIDGQLIALNANNGRRLWLHDQGAPALVLRASSTPQIIADKVIAGFSDGKLVAVRSSDGQLVWEQTIAVPRGSLEADQLVDIAANPLQADGTLYVAAYQGKLVALSLQTGRILWQQSLSSYTGLALGKAVYVTDAEGVVWAFDRLSGQRLWKQAQLKYRRLTAPVLEDGAVLVADGQAYLHWLAQTDGRILARVRVKDREQIIAPPAVANSIACVVTCQGRLSAWQARLSSRRY